ncbi:MAG TPA: tetratricopeptide repeat protein [Parvularculaceae bacterium]|nr:tetratricopeptide repeat protein [Parvularculaceae bacterium]HNS85348.1 tetratricopeptide repeat protein [Parvularculaceae bacterium]
MASLNELNSQANELKLAGRFDEAIAAFRAIVDQAPGNPVVMHNLAGALGDAGRNREAIEWANRAINAGIKAPETRIVLGRALVAEERVEEAKKAFRAAIEIQPTNFEAQKDYAQLVWMTTGDLAAALTALNQAIAVAPQSVELRMVRAQTLGYCGDARGEYDEMLEALKLSGGHPQVEMSAANAAVACNEFIAGLRHARAAFEKSPQDAQIRRVLVRALLAVGEPAEALRIVSRLRAEFPLDQGYIALQATSWRMLGDDRYFEIYDFDRFVARFPLSCPKGWKSAEAYVDDLIETLDRHHQYKTHPFGQSVRHGSQLPSLTSIDDPVLRAVGEAVRGPVMSYIERLGVGQDPLRIRNRGGYRLFSIWSIRLSSSGYHVNHVHPQGWLSSASHLRFPEPKDASDKSGWLTFGEPGLPTTPTLEAEHFVRPQKGVMAVFPSYMWHGTVPFSGPTTRMTIAADSLPAAAT